MKATTTLNRHNRPALGAAAVALAIIVSALLVGGSDAYGQTQGFAIFVDQKGSNTNGGKCTAGSWLKRDLNEVFASDSPAVQLDKANSFLTLEPGLYRIRASAPATRVGTHQIRLSLKPGSGDANPANLYGSSEYSKREDQKGDTTRSFIDGVVEVFSRSQFEVQHRCEKSSDAGFGLGNAFGNPNIFTQIFIEEFGQDSSCKIDIVDAINGLLTKLTPALNTAWPSFAINNGVDPLENVYRGRIDVPCKYGGDELCGIQLSECTKEYLELDLKSITGLAYLQFEDLIVTSCLAGSGTEPCPFNWSTSAGYSSSYSGEGSGKAYLISGESLTAKITDMHFKVHCHNPIVQEGWTETLWSGNATCTGKDPLGSATFGYCGGACQSSNPLVALSYGAVNALEIELKDLSCHVSPSYDPLNWILDILVPAVKSTLLDAVTPLIQDALNEFIAGELPFPDACSSGSVASTRRTPSSGRGATPRTTARP